jgi:hypothetical protein
MEYPEPVTALSGAVTGPFVFLCCFQQKPAAGFPETALLRYNVHARHSQR